MENQEEKISMSDVQYAIEFANSLYKENKNLDFIYNSVNSSNNLINLNNNPLTPSYDTLKNAIKNFKATSKELQAYSEFMRMWDTIYSRVLSYKVNLLAFDINSYCINVADSSEYSSPEYIEDCKRRDKFLNSFRSNQEFRDVSINLLTNGVYYTWLRDSSGTINEDTMDMDVSKVQNYALQMLPQRSCKLTGNFLGKHMQGKGLSFDLDLNYFLQGTVNIEDYDPAIYKLVENEKTIRKLKSFTNKQSELSYTNGFIGESYTRLNPNDGAWCFKYDTSNFNIIPPFASVLKAVFPNDMIEKLQMDKDMISACAIITGELKTRKEAYTDGKNPFLIEPKAVGQFMKLFQNAVGNQIKQLALPLEETKLFQFTDTNSAMYKNQLQTSASQSVSASSLVYTNDKMSQEEVQMATTIDFNEISQSLYPQFEDFLNFFINKKTKKYKFRFSMSGSTLPHLRQKQIDNFIKVSDKGMQVPIQKWGTLLGMQPQEFEAMVQEAKFGNMAEMMFPLLNSNTGVTEVGAPTKDNSDLAEGGATSREYD